MRYRGQYLMNYKLLIGRNRPDILELIRKRHFPRDKTDGTSSEESGDFDIELLQKQPSKSRLFLSRAIIRIQRRLKDLADTGFYCLNTVKEWFGYTFCYILVRRRKTRGVLRSASV